MEEREYNDYLGIGCAQPDDTEPFGMRSFHELREHMVMFGDEHSTHVLFDGLHNHPLAIPEPDANDCKSSSDESDNESSSSISMEEEDETATALTRRKKKPAPRTKRTYSEEDDDTQMDVVPPQEQALHYAPTLARNGKIPRTAIDPALVRTLACQEREALLARKRIQFDVEMSRFQQEDGLLSHDCRARIMTMLQQRDLRRKRLETTEALLDIYSAHTHVSGLVVPSAVGLLLAEREHSLGAPDVMKALVAHLNPDVLLPLLWQGKLVIYSQATATHYVLCAQSTESDKRIIFYGVVRRDSLNL